MAASPSSALIGDREADPGDAEIFRVAHQQGRVLITLDKDFAELAIVRGAPHAEIVRLVGIRAREQGPVAIRVMVVHALDPKRCAILTVEPARVRIRTSEA